MIKNIIFDFGQVLVHFEPHYMVTRYVTDEEDVKLLENVVFDRLYWDKLDEGTITNEQVLEQVYTRLPERLHALAHKIYYNWIYNIPEMEGIREVVLALKARGFKVYVLSNISTYFADHRDEIEILSYFDGCVFSGYIHMVKPSAEIFNYICTKYSLIPSETLFIDDNSKNIAGANAFGIEGYLFNGDAKKLAEYLKERL